jgi:hypothetical protein
VAEESGTRFRCDCWACGAEMWFDFEPHTGKLCERCCAPRRPPRGTPPGGWRDDADPGFDDAVRATERSGWTDLTTGEWRED